MLRLFASLILLSLLTQCAPVVGGALVASTVEYEHYQWCRTHQSDSHCK